MCSKSVGEFRAEVCVLESLIRLRIVGIAAWAFDDAGSLWWEQVCIMKLLPVCCNNKKKSKKLFTLIRFVCRWLHIVLVIALHH